MSGFHFLNLSAQGGDPIRVQAWLKQDHLYETLLIKDGHPLFWDEHLARFAKAAKALNFSWPTFMEQFPEQLSTWLGKCPKTMTCLKLTLVRQPSGHTDLITSLQPAPAAYTTELFCQGADLVISSVTRRNPGGLIPAAKHGNRQDAAQAQKEAEAQGALEALQMNEAGLVVEGTRSNLFFVVEGVLCTPPIEDGILDGVTRQKVLQVAKSMVIEIREYSPTPLVLLKAQEWFITSSLKGVLPVSTINQQPPMGPVPGPITATIATSYDQLTETHS